MDAARDKEEIKKEYLMYFTGFREKYPNRDCYYARYLDFIQKVIWKLRLMEELGVIEDSESVEKINKFIKYGKKMAGKEKISKKDRKKTKKIINFVIKILSKSKSRIRSKSNFKEPFSFCRA